jgi:hypothetical protein
MSIPILEITIAAYKIMYDLLRWEIDTKNRNVDQNIVNENLRKQALVNELITAAESRLQQLQDQM